MKRKKILAVALATTMACSLFACGKKPGEIQGPDTPNNIGIQATTGEEPENNDNNTTEKPTTENEGETSLAKDSEEAYKDFLNKKLTVSYDGDSNKGYIESGKEYYIYELLNDCTMWSRSSWETIIESSGIWEQRIDIGNDGVPELALCINNMTPSMGQVDYVFIIKYIDGKLKVVSTETGAYRSFARINKDGVLVDGGSGGASVYVEGFDYVSPDGKNSFYYYCYGEMSAPKAIVPSYYLKDAPDDYPTDFGDDWDSIVMKIYSLGRNNEDTFYFVFEDQEGNSVDCISGYEELYKKNNIYIVTEEEIDAKIQTELDKVGGKYESRFADEIEWNELDITPYENIYGTDWVSAYKNFLSSPYNYRELLVEPYEIMYGVDAIGIGGFSIADVNFDGTPELLILLKDGYSSVAEPMMVYTYDKDTYKLTQKAFVVCYGSEPGQYETDFFSMPKDSFSYKVGNNIYSFAGLSNGKFVLFSNFGDGYANYELNVYDLDKNEYTNIINDWYMFDSDVNFGTTGDFDQAQKLVNEMKYIYFVDINDENIKKYITEDYINTDICQMTGKDVFESLAVVSGDVYNRTTESTWFNGNVKGAEYLGYNFDNLIQGWDPDYNN